MGHVGSNLEPLILKTSGPVYIEVQGHKYELSFKEVVKDAPKDSTPYVRMNGEWVSLNDVK